MDPIDFPSSEVVIGLVGAVGTDLAEVASALEERLAAMKYTTQKISVSRQVIEEVLPIAPDVLAKGEAARINALMDAGNELREGDTGVLAIGVAAKIAIDRPRDADTNEVTFRSKLAYIVSSLKHPHEVIKLRGIYPNGFYLVGVFSSLEDRRGNLIRRKRISPEDAEKLIARDEDEHLPHGQRTRDTFEMSDFFVHLDGNQHQLRSSVNRFVDLLFGSHQLTPTFDEYSMFLAFAAALRSADLSRQVGAVVTVGDEIVAMGANDCPKPGGGLYWPKWDHRKREIVDEEGGRDSELGFDSNKRELTAIVEDIVRRSEHDDPDKLREVLWTSRIGDLTEFGRVVHAEMEALMACARGNVSAKGGTLYCTTFPCHNCAKHIIAAGIKRVVYVEPYPKSLAFELHKNAIWQGFVDQKKEDVRVCFEPFMGVGPRRFFDLFSMRLSSGYRLIRKQENGEALTWEAEKSHLRLKMLPFSYLVTEDGMMAQYKKLVATRQNAKGEGSNDERPESQAKKRSKRGRTTRRRKR